MTSTALVPDDDKRKRTRSPAYPFINLETAIKRAREFYKEEQRNSAHLKVAVKHWGYEAKSSGGIQTAAALIAFGLMRDDGSGDRRKLQLTKNAILIILDDRPDSAEREQAIKLAALTPKIHQELWKKFSGRLPSDEQLRHTLLLEWDSPFNENTVIGFIKEFRDTIRFANLSDFDTVTADVSDANIEGSAYVPQVGDYVQWESAGALQFREPARVREISADGQFAFVEGSATGLPVGQLMREKGPLIAGSPLPPAPRVPLSINKPVHEDVFSLSEGRVVIQWPSPLSAESIQDLKDWLKIVERKIARSIAPPEASDEG
jgi:hypothetical protein